MIKIQKTTTTATPPTNLVAKALIVIKIQDFENNYSFLKLQ